MLRLQPRSLWNGQRLDLGYLRLSLQTRFRFFPITIGNGDGTQDEASKIGYTIAKPAKSPVEAKRPTCFFGVYIFIDYSSLLQLPQNNISRQTFMKKSEREEYEQQEKCTRYTMFVLLSFCFKSLGVDR